MSEPLVCWVLVASSWGECPRGKPESMHSAFHHTAFCLRVKQLQSHFLVIIGSALHSNVQVKRKEDYMKNTANTTYTMRRRWHSMGIHEQQHTSSEADMPHHLHGLCWQERYVHPCNVCRSSLLAGASNIPLFFRSTIIPTGPAPSAVESATAVHRIAIAHAMD